MKSQVVLCARKGLSPVIIKTETVMAIDYRSHDSKGKQGTRRVAITLPRVDALKEAS